MARGGGLAARPGIRYRLELQTVRFRPQFANPAIGNFGVVGVRKIVSIKA